MAGKSYSARYMPHKAHVGFMGYQRILHTRADVTRLIVFLFIPYLRLVQDLGIPTIVLSLWEFEIFSDNLQIDI